MRKWIETAVGTLLLLAVVAVGYRLALSKLEIDVYRDRLAGLATDYEALRSNYNQAVARTAVTELIVKDGCLSLAVRTVEGVDRTIDTPFDPAGEIYCEYVLLNARLWIRRVYDSQTPPKDGLVIDDTLRHIDWKDPAARYGKAIYRSLDEGRWIITVTGDGSLGLAKVDSDAPVTLSPPPSVRDYDEIEKGIDNTLSEVTVTDVLKRLAAPPRQPGR